MGRHRLDRASAGPRADAGLWRATRTALTALAIAAVAGIPQAADTGDTDVRTSVQPASQAPAPARAGVPGADDVATNVDAAAACLRAAPGRTVMVNLTSQYAWMCQDHAPVNGTPVTTGATALGNGTPVGTWHVQAKETDRTLTGPGYSDFVHFWVPFNGDFGFHDSPWQTMPYGDPGYTTQGSNGCVHLPAAAMQWLYTWVDTDTTVTIEA